MASQNQQRVRRMASPSVKQGPLKATKSFGLKTNSPSASPTQWGTDSYRKNRRSPDFSERASPNSPSLKADKVKPLRYSPVHASVKRTGSYDTIATPYLKGEWPRGEPFVPQSQHIQHQTPARDYTDKSTQTPEEWEELDKKKSHKRSSSVGNGESLKEVRTIKARLAKSKEGSKNVMGTQRSSPLQGNHHAVTTATTQSKAIPLAIPYNIPKASASTTTRARGSVEGLNQEIEKLVLSSHSGLDDRTQEPAPDGHRAPVIELLTAGPETRSIDTQTPSGLLEPCVHIEEVPSDNSSPDSLQSESPSLPIIPVPGPHDSPRGSSGVGLLEITGKEDIKDSEREEESPKLKSCRFVREPPDGCEKVKIGEESRRLSAEIKDRVLPLPTIKKPLETCRIPSSSSAFCPLLRPYASQPQIVLAPSPKERELLSNSPIPASIDSH